MSKPRPPKKPKKNAAHVPEAGQQPSGSLVPRPTAKAVGVRRLVSLTRPRVVIESPTEAQPDASGVVELDDGTRCFVTDEPELE